MNIEKTIKSLNIYMKKMNDIDEVEVVLINDELGFQKFRKRISLDMGWIPSYHNNITKAGSWLKPAERRPAGFDPDT